MKNQNDLILAILNFGKNNLDKGVNFNELKNYLENQGFNFKSREQRNNLKEIFLKSFGTKYVKDADLENQGNYFLNIESYFHLIEHEELHESRKASTQARVYSIIAIIISTALSIISILLSTNKNTVKIDNDQFNKINAIIDKNNEMDYRTWKNSLSKAGNKISKKVLYGK